MSKSEMFDVDTILADEDETHLHYCPAHNGEWRHTCDRQCKLGTRICLTCEARAEKAEGVKMSVSQPAISREIADFASVMTNRQRSFDEELGTNNYITNTNLLMACKHMHDAVDKMEKAFADGQMISAKVYAVDVANCAHIVWTKL
jgi:hypothetical protein